MTGLALDDLLAGGWLYAAFRVLFIALIYAFLFVVLRATVRELSVAARTMTTGEDAARHAALLVLDPAQSSLPAGETIPVEAVTVIGRAAESTIVVDDPHTSARHAELRYERGQWWLRDLGSSNGTTLNGNPVRTIVGVRLGDDLQCGRVRFRFVPCSPVPTLRAAA
jgi:predicted component of type VI protein secretion system